jgi:hypothetical protein
MNSFPVIALKAESPEIASEIIFGYSAGVNLGLVAKISLNVWLYNYRLM